MQLIADGTQGPTAIPAKLTPSGVPGYAQPFLPGSVQPSVWGPDVANTILAELIALATIPNTSLNAANNHQVLDAVRFLAGANASYLTASAVLTPLQNGFVSVNASAGLSITLPAPGAAGGYPYRYRIARIDGSANTVTVAIAGGLTFLPGGVTGVTLAPYGVVDFQTDGSVWFLSSPDQFQNGLTTMGWDASGASIRMIGGPIGAMFRVDPTDLYLLLTNASDPFGNINSLRPLRVILATGQLILDGTGAGVSTGGGLAVAGALTVNSSATVAGTVTAAYLHSTGSAAIDANLTVAFSTTTNYLTVNTAATVVGSVTAAYLHSTGAAAVDGVLTVNSNATVVGSVTTAYLHSTGSAAVDGNLAVGASTTTNYLTVNTAATIAGVNIYVGGSGSEVDAAVGSFTVLTGGTFNASGDVGGYRFRPSYGFYCQAGAGSGNYSGNSFNIAWNTANAILYIDAVSLGPIGNPASDERIKQHIRPAPAGALDRVSQVEPIVYDWADIGMFKPTGSDQLGFSAQQMLSIIPSAVYGKPDAVLEDGSPQPMTLNALPLLAEAYAAIKELKARVEVLEARSQERPMSNINPTLPADDQTAEIE